VARALLPPEELLDDEPLEPLVEEDGVLGVEGVDVDVVDVVVLDVAASPAGLLSPPPLSGLADE
jgi:hypothetical protein